MRRPVKLVFKRGLLMGAGAEAELARGSAFRAQFDARAKVSPRPLSTPGTACLGAEVLPTDTGRAACRGECEGRPP